MRDLRTQLGRTVIAALWTTLCAAQGPAVGDDAPSFGVAGWTNLAKGEGEPSNKNLLGKVVMIEFWGTWCGPCVRAMPIVQRLHDAHRARGLKVLAISYETTDVIKTFADKNGFTFAFGSDPAKRAVEAYGVKSWPTTIIIGRDGKVAHVGSPHDAEYAVEKELGLETDPGMILTAAYDALVSKDKAKIRDAVGRIAEKPAMELDLKEWAVKAGGVAAADSGIPSDFDACDVCDRLAQARAAKDATKSRSALDLLATHAPSEFDAAPWARRVFGKEIPIVKKEFAELLATKRYDAAIDALCLRAPPTDVVAAAAADKNLREHAGKNAANARTEGKKAVMIGLFAFGGRSPKDNDAFWKELAVNGMRMSKTRPGMDGVLLGDGCVTAGNASAFADLRFARAFVMESLAAGKAPKTGGALTAAVKEERIQVAAAVEKKYGNGAN
jgi:peroxiredoxin